MIMLTSDMGDATVTFDVLYRLLQILGYNVTYCRNFTDIDDKLLARAERDFGPHAIPRNCPVLY